jgi:hypothetical protein
MDIWVQGLIWCDLLITLQMPGALCMAAVSPDVTHASTSVTLLVGVQGDNTVNETAVLVLLQEGAEVVLFMVSAFAFLISNGEACLGLKVVALLETRVVHAALGMNVEAGKVVADSNGIAGGGLMVGVWHGVDSGGGNGAFKVMGGGGHVGSKGMKYFITVSDEAA